MDGTLFKYLVQAYWAYDLQVKVRFQFDRHIHSGSMVIWYPYCPTQSNWEQNTTPLR